MSSIVKLSAALAATSISLAGLCSAFAQSAFPDRTVRVVVPVSAGGLSDILTRGLAQELSKKWGQPVVVENRPGSAGIVATTSVSKSNADGHTILMTNSVLYVTAPIMHASGTYDPVNDLKPVAGLAQAAQVLLTKANSSIKSLANLIDIARAKPGELTYASFGPGSASHLDMEALSSATGIKLTHVPYKGGSEVITALLAGQIDVAFAGVPSAGPVVKAGRLQALAYSGSQRTPILPEVPTLEELGFKDVVQGGWFLLMVPSNTPAAATDKIAADAREVLSRPEFVERFITDAGLDPLNISTDGMSRQLKADLDSYTKLIRELNLTPE